MAKIQLVAESQNPNNLAIVFIHGLNGDIRKTWMKDKDNEATFWPSWLSTDVDCSVWALGYDAELSRWQNNAMSLADQGISILETLATEEGLKDQALLLIGHSMGGLIIKSLIMRARETGVVRFAEVVSRVKGIVFTATPHNGSELIQLMQYFAALLRMNPHVGNLQKDDLCLKELDSKFHDYFRSMNSRIAVRTFAETKGILIGKKFLGINWGPMRKVVDSKSSEPHVPGEVAVPLAADHLSISKLDSKQDQLYKSLIYFINEDVIPLCQSMRNTLLEEQEAELVELKEEEFLVKSPEAPEAPTPHQYAALHQPQFLFSNALTVVPEDIAPDKLQLLYEQYELETRSDEKQRLKAIIDHVENDLRGW